jgi:hypothetical protein
MENQKIKKIFRSRVSVLLLGFLLAILVVVTIPLIKSMIITDLFVVGGTFFFVVFLLGGMRYIISDNKLYAKIWMIPCGSVKIMDIISIERSYNLFSSPAASLKRLKLGIKNRACMLISPIREQEFIEELKSINLNIDVNVPIKKGVWRIQDWDI